MTTRRTRKTVIYKCDKPGCGKSHVAPYTDYKLASAHARAAGWTAAAYKGKWFNFCDWLHQPATDLQFAVMLDPSCAGK